VRCGEPVNELGADFVEIGGERIATRTVMWAAGVRASALTRDLGAPLDRAGRVLVADDLSLPGRPEVFVIGDLIAKQQDGRSLPGVAQLALQSGAHAARNIVLHMAGRSTQPFTYIDKGSMATIGRNKAVAQIGKFQLSGVLAWWLWLTVHILFLVEFRRRLSVLFEWAWSYLTWNRGSRVIVDVVHHGGARRLVAPPSTPAQGGARRIAKIRGVIDGAQPPRDTRHRTLPPESRSRA